MGNKQSRTRGGITPPTKPRPSRSYSSCGQRNEVPSSKRDETLVSSSVNRSESPPVFQDRRSASSSVSHPIGEGSSGTQAHIETLVPEANQENTPRSVTQERRESLLSIFPDSIPIVPCKDVPIKVVIYDVYDGDTVKFLMFCGPKCHEVIKLSLRLLGIDTPELRSGQGRLPEEKIAGEMARKRLAELIGFGKEVLTTIIIRDWDKFGGRVLGDIILPSGKSVVEVLIAEGYGRLYIGDKKEPWTMEDFHRKPFKLL